MKNTTKQWDKNVKTLNKFMKKYVKEHKILSIINENVIPQEPNPGQTYNVLNIYTNQDSWQELPVQTEDVFNLQAPVVGVLKDQSVNRLPRLKRIVIGYVACSRAANDYNTFKKLMNAFTIQTLIELKEHYGFDHTETTTGKCYLTFETPGQPGVYFKDMENYAGFEIRAFSDCVKTNIIKGTLCKQKVG